KGEDLPSVATGGPPVAPEPAEVGRQASRPSPRKEEVPAATTSPASSPRARRLARELGVDWTRLTGSRRNGRVRQGDVRAAAASAEPGELVPHTATRRLIAARMVAGVTQAAPVTLTTKVDATNLVNVRTQFRTTDAASPSYTDLLLKLTAAALVRHPL